MMILIGLMLLIYLATNIWLVVKAFKTGIGWGFAVLFIPFFVIVYAIKHWEEAKKPFLAQLTSGVALAIAFGFYMSGSMNGRGASIPNSGIGTLKGAPPTALTQEQKGALDLTDKGLALLEKLPQNEKNQKIIAVTRGYIRQRKGESTDAERMELNRQMAALLQRTDLTEKERQGFEKIAQELKPAQVLPVAIPSQNPVPEKREAAAPPIPAPVPNEKPTVVESPVFPPRAAAPAQEAKLAPQTDSGPVYKEIRPDRAKEYIGSTVLLSDAEGKEEELTLIGVSGRSLEFEKRLGGGTFSVWYQDSEIKSMRVLEK